ncbi:MAG TPA: alpha/beta hydrolase [Gammaproteobacteria bacterium]|nr:alpha/beta hydrolase [Gammaproteobacteria bacterium]
MDTAIFYHMKKTHSNKRKPKTPLALRLLRLTYNTLGRVFPAYFGRRAYALWFTTTRFKTPPYERPALAAARNEQVSVNGLQIAVYLWQHESIAPAATLLFIHGWTGRGSQVASYIERLTGLGYRVISFDGPAHGNTPGKQTSLLEMTDVIFALNKKYGDFDAAITHSFGGMILTFAMSLGLKVDRAALICPPNNFQVILDNFQRILQLPDCVMQAMERISYATHGQVIRDLVDMENNVRRLSCKSLLIHDEDDTDISWHSSEKIARAWPGARFIKTQGLGHRRIVRDSQVVQHIIDFLDPIPPKDHPETAD